MDDPPADRSKLATKVGSTRDMEKRMKSYSLEKQLKIKTIYTIYFLSRRVDVQGCELFRDSISSLTEVNDPNVISPLFREVLDLVLNHGGYRFVKTQFFRLLLEMGAQSLAGLTPDAECLGFDNNNEFEQMVKWTEEYIGKLLPHFNAYKQYPQSEVTLKIFGSWHPHPAAFPNERKPVTFHVKDYVWSGIDFEDMFVDVCKAASPNDPYNTDWTTKEISDAKDHFFGMLNKVIESPKPAIIFQERAADIFPTHASLIDAYESRGCELVLDGLVENRGLCFQYGVLRPKTFIIQPSLCSPLNSITNTDGGPDKESRKYGASAWDGAKGLLVRTLSVGDSSAVPTHDCLAQAHVVQKYFLHNVHCHPYVATALGLSFLYPSQQRESVLEMSNISTLAPKGSMLTHYIHVKNRINDHRDSRVNCDLILNVLSWHDAPFDDTDALGTTLDQLLTIEGVTLSNVAQKLERTGVGKFVDTNTEMYKLMKWVAWTARLRIDPSMVNNRNYINLVNEDVLLRNSRALARGEFVFVKNKSENLKRHRDNLSKERALKGDRVVDAYEALCERTFNTYKAAGKVHYLDGTNALKHFNIQVKANEIQLAPSLEGGEAFTYQAVSGSGLFYSSKSTMEYPIVYEGYILVKLVLKVK